MKGKIIAIEGVDGVGKTTLAKGLVISKLGIYYKTPGGVTREDRALYDDISISIKDRFEFYMDCCRNDLYEIQRYVSDGSDVICDRFITSTIAHHKQMCPGLNVSKAEKFCTLVPRIQILLIATSKEIQRRLYDRTRIFRFERDEDLFLRTHKNS